MPSADHWSDDGMVHVRVSTIHLDLLAQFIEWGGEIIRERKHAVPLVWWNPFTWGRHEWRREGSPGLVDVAFFRGDGVRIADERLNPALTESPGFQKMSIIYFYVTVGSSPPPDLPRGFSDLGNDARSVTKVVVRYMWDGTEHELTDGR